MNELRSGFPRGFVRRCAFAVFRRPHLWWTALIQYQATLPRSWWQRRPHLPVPDAKYVRFRLETQYGIEAAPQVDHVIEYLEWCHGMRSVVGSHDG